jgi:RNA polymerase sigma-54 factor
MYYQRQIPLLRPLTTAHMAQTMSLLELNTMELRQKIESELARNPALELIDETRCPSCQRVLRSNSPCPTCSNSQNSSPEQPIVFLSARQDFYSPSGGSTNENDLASDEYPAQKVDLVEHILRQIGPELPVEDRQIAYHILSSLDEDGLLPISTAEIAQYYHVLRSRVERVIRQIQAANPIGVGSPSPQDALRVQIEILRETSPVPPFITEAIQAGLEMLSPHRSAELGRLIGISALQARQVVRFIADNLNPYPARAYWGEAGRPAASPGPDQNVYTLPDIIINRVNETEDTPLIVEIAMPFYGTLRVNPLFREAIQQAPDNKADLWQTDLEQATLLVKCIQQRNHTIVRLMQRLVVIQRGFILYGESHLHPLTRAVMADQLQVHESTMSRAVSDKAIQLPNKRIIPLSMFFDRSLHVRSALKAIIDQETSPLSDASLAQILSMQGYQVARRTVAKYRAMEGILPAHLRFQANPS